MQENLKEPEVVEEDIEVIAPEREMVARPNAAAIEDMLYTSQNITKMVDAQKTIRMALLRLAQPGDWVRFKSGDADKAEIGYAGAMRIGSTMGVNFSNWTAKKEKGTDTSGEWYRWEFECDASYRSRVVRGFGRAGTRDRFFGKAHGEWRPVHEVDEGNIKMAARRSAMKDSIKILFGLHHMDPAEVERYGIKLDSAGGHSFTSNSKAKISEPQRRRLYALTTIYTPDEIKAKIKGMGFENSKDITKDKYDEVCNWIEGK